MSEQWFHETDEGRWTDNALKLLPKGNVEFKGVAKRGYSVFVGSKIVGAMRYHQGHGWICRINGFEWKVTPEQGTARFNLEYSPVRMIAGADTARRMIRKVIENRPENANG